MESFSDHTEQRVSANILTGVNCILVREDSCFLLLLRRVKRSVRFWATTYPSHEIQACYVWWLGGGFTGYGNVVDIVFVGTECMLASK